jgi:hypothetical protein
VSLVCSHATALSLGFLPASPKPKQLALAAQCSSISPTLLTYSIPFLYIYFAFYALAFTPLPIAYTVEILPFTIRSKGMALFTSVATLGNSFNQFVNPVALQAIAWK